MAEAWQAHLFGFPNAFLGLIAEPVVIAIAVASLGGVRFPRCFMLSAQVVYALGLVFAYWLFTQSMFVIGALCPWCLLVTVSTTLVFASLTHVNIRDGNLPLPHACSAGRETRSQPTSTRSAPWRGWCSSRLPSWPSTALPCSPEPQRGKHRPSPGCRSSVGRSAAPVSASPTRPASRPSTKER